MQKKLNLLIVFVFAFSIASFSNGKLLPGYYISLTGDTIRCNIEYGDWNINPKLVQVSANGVLKEFKASEIKGFGVFGFKEYTSANVHYHASAVSGDDIPSSYSDSLATDAYFLLAVQKGILFTL